MPRPVRLRVRPDAPGQPGQRARIERERMLDQPDQLRVVDVVAQLAQQRAHHRKLAVECLLKRGPGVLEPPDAVGDDREYDRPHDPFHGEQPEDERAAEFLSRDARQARPAPGRWPMARPGRTSRSAGSARRHPPKTWRAAGPAAPARRGRN